MRSLNDIKKKHIPKGTPIKNAIAAFIGGGLISIIGQLILDYYVYLFDLTPKEAITPMVITVIFITCIMTGLGIYDKIAKYLGAGIFIPITGFANSMCSSALESKSEGLIFGIGSNMFKLAGSVLTYGVVSAYIVSFVRYIFL
ncbi:MAG: stage V sporulation protein AC [Erysipelotrichaceae bacterium]|nr:stage V sporulation protein AC [Erysipelotrichaceae bacterium]MBQ9987866.1 stage V sporulation protein AC [Erysipelotrichales bacterium]MBR3693031.1 stage V sporulation protein AC [Erysipelotrichales bacterium]